MVDTKISFTLTEANQNFSQVVKKVDANGSVVILKNNKPQYVVSKFNDAKLTENETLLVIANMILTEHKHAFEVLANG